MNERPRFNVEAIGVVRSPFTEKRQAPRQPSVVTAERGAIELYSGLNLEHAVEDLARFRFVWVLFWFHLSEGYRPKVLPPRSRERRGVLATRSPHRPNPIGLSLLELESVNGLRLEVAGLDLVDGTPVLDIKPYLPYADARPDAGHGWLEDEARAADPLPEYGVTFSEPARAALELLRSHGVELEPEVRRALALGPAPHPYRRIRADRDGYRLALKDYRIRFRPSGERELRVTEITTGHRPRDLALAAEDDAALAPHRALAAFLASDRGSAPAGD